MFEKAETLAFSSVKSEDFQYIKKKSGLDLELSNDPPFLAPEKRIDAFAWDDRTEPSQSDR